MADLVKTIKTKETLFVGVGGIGSDIVAKIAAMCKDEEAENLRFVVMDTDANWLKTINMKGAPITKVQTSSSLKVKEYLDKDDDARINWFPVNSTLYGKSVSAGAGQVRAISRLALNNTIRTGEINKLYNVISELLLKDSEGLKQELRVVIVSSATGGTGSGMAMMTAMLIREYLHEKFKEKGVVIRGFLVLPSVMDTVINTQAERDSQYRNGYATIKEINAFMMIATGFGGTENSLMRYKDLHVTVPTATGGTKELSCLPFDFCFLLEAADQNSEKLESIDAYKDSAAMGIYEQMIGPMEGKAFSLEDNIIKEFAEKNKFARNRFGGIGASKLIYPYEDIADYAAYTRALQRIGGLEASGDWSAYDKAYKNDWKEYAKKRTYSDEPEPTPATSYIAALESDNSLFGKDIKADICGVEDVGEEVDEIIEDFIGAIERYVGSCYVSHEEDSFISVEETVKTKYDYEKREQPSIHLEQLRTFESRILMNAYQFAKNQARSILYSAPDVRSSDVNEYHIEHLLKKRVGTVHPSSARYILYKLSLRIAERCEEVKGQRKTDTNKIRVYAPGYQEDDTTNNFDIVARFSPEKEKSLDALVELAQNDRSFFDKLQGGFDTMWNKVNEHMHRYAEGIKALMYDVLYDALYDVAIEYVESLNVAYKKFYNTFESKAIDLDRKRDGIVDGLKNRKGSAIHYYCASKDKLEAITERIPEGTNGFLLPEELSAEIFESIKKNAALERIRIYDKFAEGTYIDIFSSILIEYFRQQIRDDGGEYIDINIIDAISFDKELEDYLEAKKFDSEDFDIESIKLDDLHKKVEFEEALRKGQKLSAPGLNGQTFVEPRDVNICTFSTSLLNVRDIKVKSIIESKKIQAIPSDAVSKYEMRFFTAIYNITPDTIPLFRGPQRDKMTGEIDTYETGEYFKAYHDYSKNIGPNSMASSTISTHIDKRWDAIVSLPEIDFDVLYEEIRLSHISLICGLVLGLIRKLPSTKYDKKRVFKIINEDGDQIPLIVSNGTECDEFYEVLDALYHDKQHANMLIEAAEEYTRNDIEKNCTYNQSAFVSFLKDFRIPGSHNTPTSLFEIPLLYYNSLPNVLTDNNEISIMIDAVIALIESVVKKLERIQDQNAFLCRLLEEQFYLLIESFNNDEYEKEFGIRKNTMVYENIVVSMVSQKVIKKLKEVEVSDCAKRVEAIRNEVREPDSLYE